MQEFINSIGEKNIYFMLGVIIVIVIALLIVVIIENKSNNRYVIESKPNKRKKVNNDLNDFELNIEEKKDVVYVENEETKEDAKKAIEEAAKKMVYEEKPDLIGPTFFERVQEEKSIISYNELINTDLNIDEENEKVLADEGNEPITIDELLYKGESIEEIEPQEIIVPTIGKEQLVEDNNIFLNEPAEETKKFKSSDVISPVFGVKRDIIYKKEYNELGETINIKELEVEIKKTEDFLKELKKLKDKLD